ncbi:MAG: metallophosphoesterase family protein [Bacteroidales bacterium]|nr:metallophosphoesterase family protein [Bacteroidales bacterium]
MKIGVLSDTHGTVPKQVYDFFMDCDELWHAGDLGVGVLDELKKFKPVVAVYGNMDGYDVRGIIPETQFFTRENHKILMTHIGGHPKRFEAKILHAIESLKPNIFVCGHSHILRIMYDAAHEMLCINPGAAGRSGFHKVSTLVRFSLDEQPHDLEILDFPKFESLI